MCLFAVSAIFGTGIGPVASGWIELTLKWRWIQWIHLMYVIFRDTAAEYRPVIPMHQCHRYLDCFGSDAHDRDSFFGLAHSNRQKATEEYWKPSIQGSNRRWTCKSTHINLYLVYPASLYVHQTFHNFTVVDAYESADLMVTEPTVASFSVGISILIILASAWHPFNIVMGWFRVGSIICPDRVCYSVTLVYHKSLMFLLDLFPLFLKSFITLVWGRPVLYLWRYGRIPAVVIAQISRWSCAFPV